MHLRLAHISDPHFASITYNLNQFLSKRWLGNCNLILYRHKTYKTDHLHTLPTLFSSLKVEAVAITGDLTTTSLDQEYQKAKLFVESFNERGMKSLLLPGNHDIYTKESEKVRRFYQYFPSEEIEVKEVKKGFWWVGINSAYASNIFLSNGKFTAAMEKQVIKALDQIPRSDQIIVGNHFPLFGRSNPRHDLMGAKRLQSLLKRYPNVILYLHGHDHIHYLIDKRKEGFPLVLNSGSVSHLPGGGFYIIELGPKGCTIQRYTLHNDGIHWAPQEEQYFHCAKSS